MGAARNPDMVSVDLDRGEAALILSEDDDGLSVRVATGAEATDGGADLPAAQELAVALAMRLLKDPDFRDDVLDWYYEHQDEDEDEEDEGPAIEDEE
jgi:hypothetical protein